MKTRIVSALILTALFISAALSAQSIDWNTFAGSDSIDYWDYCNDVDIDSSGNIYLAGYCGASWGTPVNPFNGGNDWCIVKLNSEGVYQWHTFLGSSANDSPMNVAVDSSGNIYVTGYGKGSWGTPLNGYTAGEDILVAKLDSNGTLLWHTFFGSAMSESGRGICVSGSAVYVCGVGGAGWGTPVNAYSGGTNADGFVLKLNSDGALQWNTFCGSTGSDILHGVCADLSGNPVAAGESSGTWGTPLNPHAGSDDIMIASFNTAGSLQWNTFQGGSSSETASEIAIDSDGSIILNGYGLGTFGSPLDAFADSRDLLVMKLNSSGVYQWHSFFGGSGLDTGYAVVINSDKEIFIAGDSFGSWGTPFNDSTGGTDVVLIKLDPDGAYRWHGFLGGGGNEGGYGIALADTNKAVLAGYSSLSWGSPLNALAGGADFMACRISEGVPSLEVSGKGQVIADEDTTPDSADDTDFGTMILGGTDIVITYTIENTGSEDLSIEDITISGTGSSAFSVTASPGSTVGAGLTGTFDITCSPGAAGVHSAGIDVKAGSGGGITHYNFDIQVECLPSLDVTGLGLLIADGDTTPSTADDTDFGKVLKGKSLPHTFTLENTGPDQISIDSVVLSGLDAAEFTVSAAPSATVDAGLTDTVEITFTPSDTGLKTAELEITISANGSTRTVIFSIQGEGKKKSDDGGGCVISTESANPIMLIMAFLAFGMILSRRGFRA